MPDIYAGNDNRSLMIDGVRYAIPQTAPIAKFYDVIPNSNGKYDILPADKNSKSIYCVRVDTNGELRNFNIIGDLTVTLGESVDGPNGAVSIKSAVPIDLTKFVPPKAKGVRLSYSGTVSTKLIGSVGVYFSPDSSKHNASQIYLEKETDKIKIQLFGTVDIAFRRQNGSVFYYSTDSNEGLDKYLLNTKFLIRGWYL